jgi:hypothetical protein
MRNIEKTCIGLLISVMLVLSSFLMLSTLSLAGALDPVSVYESDTPIPQLLQQYAGSELLGRPTDKSITINIIAPAGMETYVDFGTTSGIYPQKSATSKSLTGEPIEIVLSNLSPNTRYYYRTNFKLLADSNFRIGIEHSFVTQKPNGSTFIFDLQADPHMDGHSDSSTYIKTLQTEANDKPDFIVDLGDTFMTEKFASTEEQVLRRYIETRAFFDIPGGSSPLFLVNGNHDGEFGWLFSSCNQNNSAYWAINARKLYYPNPYSDGFYLGSSTHDSIVGLHENYYSWTWGNALFVVLDPYTYSSDFKKTGNMWDSTIGNEQYLWFKQTLESSNATYKFVFEHHMLAEYRGMTTWADKYEWGGYNNKGVWDFNQSRPNWDLPIHQLMVKNNVTIFFQGHDHLFCKEEKDGVIYQEVPQPSVLRDNGDANITSQYVGQVIPSSGYLRIQVSPQNVSVEYVKTSPPESAGIAFSYNVLLGETSPSSTPVSTPAPTPSPTPPTPSASPQATPTQTKTSAPTQSPTSSPPIPELPGWIVLTIFLGALFSFIALKKKRVQ